MPTEWSIAAKRRVRAAARRLGYEIVPFSQGFYEVQRRLLQQIDLLVDVGADTGQYVERARALGYRGAVVSFEPCQRPFGILAAKATGTWIARQSAVGHQTGRAILNIAANGGSSSLLVMRPEHLRAAPASRIIGHEEVATTTLDRELEGVAGDRVWLKLDVQGAEMDVLTGAARSMARVRTVQTEMSFSPLYEQQTDYVRLIDVLRQHGLHLRHLEPVLEEPSTGFLLQADGLFTRLA